MESVLVYLLKSAVILSIFFAGYWLLLRKDVNFKFNRNYLLIGLLSAAILPAIYFTRTVIVEAQPQQFEGIPITIMDGETIPTETPTDWWQIAGIAYLVVTGFFLLKFLLQIGSVLAIICKNRSVSENGYSYIRTKNAQSPFSFFKYIVFNPTHHDAEDLDLILEHERIHASEWHSADILISNLAQSLLWFNPLSWLYRKSIEQNLEFLADRGTVETKSKLKQYQHALVKVSVADLKPALTNHFYQSFIKKRIMMLNTNKSKSNPGWKMAIIAPLILGFMFMVNLKTEAQVKEVTVYEIQDDSDIEIVINKNTTKDQLEEYKDILKDKNIDVKFKKLKYSKEGLLTSIDFRFEDNATGNTGRMTRKDENGINAFRFRKNNDEIGVSGIEEQKVSFQTVSATSPSEKIFIKRSNSGDKNNFVVEIDTNDVARGYGKNKIYVISGDSAKANQVRFYSTSNAEMIDDSTKVIRWAQTYSTSANGIGTIHLSHDLDSLKEKVANSAKILKGTGKKFNFGTANSIRVVTTDSTDKPLYVVDGIVQAQDYVTSGMEPSEIAAINVLKGKKATEKYGTKGKNGVIEIHTKVSGYSANADNKQAIIFKLKAETTDADLDNLKNKIKESTGMDVEFRSIQRNSDGLIKHIDISGKKGGSKASASWDNDFGIPDITIGLSRSGGVIISSSYSE